MERPPRCAMSALDAVIRVNSIESAKLMVRNGLHPIRGGNGPKIPVLYQYFKFSSNTFLTWLVSELHPDDIGLLADEILKVVGVPLGYPDMWKRVGRHPAHALLITGNAEFTRAIVDKHHHCVISERSLPATMGIMHMTDRAGRTALHIAAERDIRDAVKNLLQK